MKVCFVVVTFDRDALVTECVESIQDAYGQIPHIRVEICVVYVKGRIPPSDSFTEARSVKCSTITEAGLSRARNSVLENHDADYYVFIDDDAKINRDFLCVLYEHSKKYNVQAYAGRIIDQSTGKPFSKIFSCVKSKRLSYFDYQYFLGSAHVVHRRLFEKIGLYDTDFGVGTLFKGSEESDLFFRMKRTGVDVIYIPALVVYHPSDAIKDQQKVYNYAYAVAAMFIKQMGADIVHSCIFIYFLTQILIKNTLWCFLVKCHFPVACTRDKKYHYGAVVVGSIHGAQDFIMQRILKKRKKK